MHKNVALGVIVAMLVFASTQVLGGEHLRCESEVAGRLTELKVVSADIAGIFTVPKYVGRAQFELPRVSTVFDGVTA